MRLFLVLTMLLSSLGCSKPPIEPCVAEYHHLRKLAQRKQNKGVRQRFVTACVAAWDVERHRCIMAASNVTQALACRPGKIHPG